MSRSRATTPSLDSSCRPKLHLLGGFSLSVAGDTVSVPMHSRRVLAYVSLYRSHDYSCDRSVLAERLWPEATTDHARASLRTALWRIRQASPDLVEVQQETVSLAPTVEVDVQSVRETADRLLTESDGEQPDSQRLLLSSGELLPGWDETWLVLAREQLRQTRLHALERYAARLKRAARYPEAIDIMLTVIADEPLRESAHGLLIEIHLSEGNTSEALRQFEICAELLWRELGLRPSRELQERVGISTPTPSHE